MSKEFFEEQEDISGKYLTFFLGKEEYGVDVLRVQEIIGLVGISPVPKTAPFVKGVINLRGKVIPVMDLNLRFGLAEKNHTKETCIMVVNTVDDNESQLLKGAVIDRVSGVIDVNENEIEPPPDFGNRIDSEYVTGVAKTASGIKILLDIRKVLESTEVNLEKASL